MVIKWDKLLENERQQFEEMNETDKFIYFLLLQFRSPYGWGKENPISSDCSGAVCMALFAATGLLIRTTADDLLKRVFTRKNPGRDDIRAVFYVSRTERKHGGRIVPAGTATHIAGIVDDGVILNSQAPVARIRKMAEVSNWYLREGFDVLVRGLDRSALDRLAREGKTVFGLDPEFRQFFNIGAQR